MVRALPVIFYRPWKNCTLQWIHWFIASILPENRAMMHVFTKYYPHAESKIHTGDIEIRMPFEDKSPESVEC